MCYVLVSTGSWIDLPQSLWAEGPPIGFVPLRKRWVVERAHAWNERARRPVTIGATTVISVVPSSEPGIAAGDAPP